MKKDKFYFGIFDSWDCIDDEIIKETREMLAECNNCEENEVSDEWVQESIMSQLDDEKCNLDVETGGFILAFADIGRWCGRVTGYKKIGTNVKDILESFYGGDDCTWYADKYNVRAISCDHDGRTTMVFRMVESEEKLDALCEKIYDGKIKTERELFKATKSIRPFVADVYGWKEFGWQARN